MGEDKVEPSELLLLCGEVSPSPAYDPKGVLVLGWGGPVNQMPCATLQGIPCSVEGVQSCRLSWLGRAEQLGEQ